MSDKKWHVFFTFDSSHVIGGGLVPYDNVTRDLHHLEFVTEEEARDWIEIQTRIKPAPPGVWVCSGKIRLQFVIHGDRINPTVRTVEKMHTTLEQEVVWERE